MIGFWETAERGDDSRAPEHRRNAASSPVLPALRSQAPWNSNIK